MITRQSHRVSGLCYAASCLTARSSSRHFAALRHTKQKYGSGSRRRCLDPTSCNGITDDNNSGHSAGHRKRFKLSKNGSTVPDEAQDLDNADCPKYPPQQWEEDLQQTALKPFLPHGSSHTTDGAASADLLAWWQNLPSNVFGLWTTFQYRYYNWRKDVWSDLQLFSFILMAIIIFGGFVKHWLVDWEGSTESHSIWVDFYEVIGLTLSQGFPDREESAPVKAFAVVFASVGLMAFALELALVQQVILTVLEDNVKVGSPVCERGHIVVLAWASSQRDMEVIWKVLAQMCLAYRNDGGRVVVVLSQRDKLAMEAAFLRTIALQKRRGTTFVFRQGSPLVPDDLRTVNVNDAESIIVVSDSSRRPREADAQSLRCAVLLDELDFPGFGVPDRRTAHVIVELLTTTALPLMLYSCSRRILAVPVTQMIARRLARAVGHPVTAEVAKMMWSFNSSSQTYLHYFPQLAGRSFGELAFHFDNAIILGLINRRTGLYLVGPPPETLVCEDDELIVLRPTSMGSADFQPLAEPVAVPLGDWAPLEHCPDEDELALRLGIATGSGSGDSSESDSESSAGSMMGSVDAGKAGLYILPAEYLARTWGGVRRVLVCGWSDDALMVEILRELDQGSSLAAGSSVTILSPRPSLEVMAIVNRQVAPARIEVRHIQGDPLDPADLAALDLPRFQTAVVLCDALWLDPDQNTLNGIATTSSGDFMRLDAMILAVQIGIRRLLQEAGHADINIVCEKVAFEGTTRFEDRMRLPMGVSINFTAHAATLLTQTAYNPRLLLALANFGAEVDTLTQDTSEFAGLGERLSFWELQKRVQTLGKVLVGYYEIPDTDQRPVSTVLNPVGTEFRARNRVWNKGRNNIKLLMFSGKTDRKSISEVRGFTQTLEEVARMGAVEEGQNNLV